MSNLKWITSIIFTFIFFNCYALDLTSFTNPTVSFIDYDQQDIYLSNDVVWHIDNKPFVIFHPSRVYTEGHLKEVNGKSLENWTIGDEVSLEIGKGKGQRGLIWLLVDQSISSKFSKSSKLAVFLASDNVPKISKISEDGREIELTNGSKWTIGWWSGLTSEGWKVDDRVMAYRDFSFHLGGSLDSNTHILWNLDRSTYKDKFEKINATLLK
jgi:hypothetical protein